jgi:hypothetical protein
MKEERSPGKCMLLGDGQGFEGEKAMAVKHRKTAKLPLQQLR